MPFSLCSDPYSNVSQRIIFDLKFYHRIIIIVTDLSSVIRDMRGIIMHRARKIEQVIEQLDDIQMIIVYLLLLK